VSVRFVLSRSIYPEECLADAVAAYRDLCSVAVLESDSKSYQIELSAAPGIGDDTRAAREFLNYLLDASAEGHLKGAHEEAG
jgi:hypothetical protein